MFGRVVHSVTRIHLKNRGQSIEFIGVRKIRTLCGRTAAKLSLAEQVLLRSHRNSSFYLIEHGKNAAIEHWFPKWTGFFRQ
jgi:hypothetical protein